MRMKKEIVEEISIKTIKQFATKSENMRYLELGKTSVDDVLGYLEYFVADYAIENDLNSKEVEQLFEDCFDRLEIEISDFYINPEMDYWFNDNN